MGADDRIAVAPLAGVIHFDRDARQALDHELARHRRMPTGSASLDVDLLRRFELGLGDFHLVEEDVSGVLRDSSQRSVAHRARLLVDLLEHEMLEPTLLRGNWVPGDVLDLALNRLSVEVGDLYAFGRDYC